jgi:hypothetical protein
MKFEAFVWGLSIRRRILTGEHVTKKLHNV